MARSRASERQERFRFCVLGRFRVLRGGEQLTDKEVSSRKGRTLLKLLLLEHDQAVSTDRIVEALWGDAPPSKAEENVATLVSRLRAVLGADAIVGRRGGYSFALSPRLELDLEQAQRSTTEAHARLRAGEPSLARVAAERAVELLQRGRLLEDDADAPWLDEHRRVAGDLLAEARRSAWRAALELSDYRGALGHARAAVATDPLDEEAHRAVMLAHHWMGEQGAALAAYERLREILAEELGADPSPQSAALHVSVLRAEVPAGPQGVVDGKKLRIAPDPEFVGREHELEWLSQAWSDAAGGRPSFMLISGEAGIGKTRLADEIVALARSTGGIVVEARCYEAESSLFLQPLVDAVRGVVVTSPPEVVREAVGEWAGTLAELVPEVGRMLRPLSYERGPAELEHRRSFEAMTSFVQRLAHVQPLVLYLDDLHNAGSSTIELLHFMRRRLSADRVLMLATMRPEEGAGAVEQLEDVAQVVTLGPLSHAAVTALARTMGAADAAEQVFGTTRGHTLFVIETLRALAEEPSAIDAAAVPQSLRDIVTTRARRAGGDVEELLRGTVVLGTSFDLHSAAQLLELSEEETARRAQRALEARLVSVAGSAYEFANDLIRQALYETTPLPTRIMRHRRAAQLLSANPEAVAMHAAAAGDWEIAFKAWLEAAERAMQAFANKEAHALLDQALSAAGLVKDPLATARARLTRGRVREHLGDYPGAHDDHSVALQLAQAAGDEPLQAEALERLGWTAYYAREIPTMFELTTRAWKFAERAAAAPAARPSALVLLARARHAQGDLPGATEAVERALAADPDPATQAAAANVSGMVLQHSDRFGEARAVQEAAIDECRRTGTFRLMLSSMWCAGLACGDLGDFAAAKAHFESLGRMLGDFADPLYKARHAIAMSWLRWELGELSQAWDLAQEALEHTRSVRAGVSEPGGHALLAAAECALLRGDDADAAGFLAAAESLTDSVFAFKWRFELRRLELKARLAPEVAEELLALARHHKSSKYEALALAHLGRRDAVAKVARKTGSDYVIAASASESEAKEAISRMAARLPSDLRESFLSRGRVSVALATAARRKTSARSRPRHPS